MSEKINVDIVYTWVNGEDPDYIKEAQNYADKPKDINPERYRDTYELLKYSLRSVRKYLDWCRDIYIVTAKPQVPEWLDIDHPRVKIIHHNEIIDSKYLPTFNPNCIESFLHNIPKLSDHFLYLNDDFFFGSKTNLEDFIYKGKHRIFNTLLGENLKWRIYDGENDIIGLGIIEHTPLFINKVFWENMMKLYPKKMEETRMNRFRQPGDLMTYKLYRYYMLKKQPSICKPIKLGELLKINAFYKITNNLPHQQKAIRKLETKSPKFYCLNDDQRDHPNIEVVDLIKKFLVRSFPEKSEFEK